MCNVQGREIAVCLGIIAGRSVPRQCADQCRYKKIIKVESALFPPSDPEVLIGHTPAFSALPL